MKLYELTQEMEVLQRMLEHEDCDRESFEAAINSLNIERNEKIANIGLLVKSINADIFARDQVIEELVRKNKTDANRIEWLKSYLVHHVDKTVKTPLVTVSKQAGREKVIITGNIPSDYLIPQEPKQDKVSLLKDLKAGVDVPGAELGRGDDYVVIR